jgi:hypothetical protein
MSIQLIQQYYSKAEKMIRYSGTRNESSLLYYMDAISASVPPTQKEKGCDYKFRRRLEIN